MSTLQAHEVWSALQKGGSARMTAESPAKFEVGIAVMARQFNHPGHIRLPEYVQGYRGTIAADYGMFIFPDQHAKGIKEAQRLYSVRFEATDIWPDNSNAHGAIYVDLFESYLTKA